MSEPKFKVGDKVRILTSNKIFEIGKVVDCVKTFDYDTRDTDKWAYGEVGQQDATCKFERWLTLVTPLEELL